MRGRSSRGAPGEPQAGHEEEIPHGKATKIWNALPKELWRALEVSRVGLVTKWGQNQAQVGLDDFSNLNNSRILDVDQEFRCVNVPE